MKRGQWPGRPAKCDIILQIIVCMVETIMWGNACF